MRIGIVCPYSLDVPGGVQNHVTDLAESLLGLGHQVSVLAPTDSPEHASYVVPAGRTVPVTYNGSVARMSFGPVVAARCRRWLRDGKFDVLHLHEPAAPSLSLLALWAADCPVVATHHTAGDRSRALAASAAILRPSLEKIGARIAVSEEARDFQLRHLGAEPLVIPNGLYVDRFASASPRDEWRGSQGTLAFVGRLGEPRKGFPVLATAFGDVARERPGLRMVVVGRGDVDEARRLIPAGVREQATFLGAVSDPEKASALRTADVCVAPNTAGESFGIVLAEAMSAGAPILASDIDAFRRVLRDGRAGALFPVGDAAALAASAAELLDDAPRRKQLSDEAKAAVRAYDWSTVARDVVRVYETVAGGPGVVGVSASRP
jgi:phosphatidylinositol alpha-mannosyltransferase